MRTVGIATLHVRQIEPRDGSSRSRQNNFCHQTALMHLSPVESADFPHPAFRLASSRGTAAVPNERARGEAPRARRTPLRAESGWCRARAPCESNQEATDRLVDVIIDRSIRRQAGAVAEVRRPAPQQAVSACPSKAGGHADPARRWSCDGPARQHHRRLHHRQRRRSDQLPRRRRHAV
jgi:hypothetical protein